MDYNNHDYVVNANEHIICLNSQLDFTNSHNSNKQTIYITHFGIVYNIMMLRECIETFYSVVALFCLCQNSM